MKNRIFAKITILLALIIWLIFVNSVQAANNNVTITNTNVTGTNTSNSNVSQNQTQNQTKNQIQNQSQNQTQTKINTSSNANLSNLGIYTYDFTGFKPGIISYNTTVPNSVTSVQVYAVTQDGATYDVSGNTNLNVGENKVTITVTSADKTTTKNYYIYVERQSLQGDKEPKENLELKSIEIDEKYGTNLEPEFDSDIYEYTVKLNGDIEKLPIEATAINEKAKVKITGNENLKDGENIILIKVTYGTDDVEYKITVRKNMDAEETKKTQWDDSYSKYLSSEHIQYGWYIIGGILLLYIIVFIVWIIIVKRKKKKLANNKTIKQEIPRALRK